MRGGGVGAFRAHLPQKVISNEYTVNNENNTADNNKHAISLNPILDKKKNKKKEVQWRSHHTHTCTVHFLATYL